MPLLNKYLWVVNALYRAGDRGLTFKELNEKWVDDYNISYGEPIPRQTFDRWKNAIGDTFGIDIDCHKKGGYRYYLSNPEDLSRDGLNRWLLDTYSTINVLSEHAAIKDRILTEEIPSSYGFLTEIMDAMRENKTIELTYRRFEADKSRTFPVEPYCVKMFQKRWYLLARNVDVDKMRLYGFDRIEKVRILDEHFRLPAGFDAKTYFSTYFGVVHDEDIKPEIVRIRAYRTHPDYLRTLPIHASQKEVYTCADYTDFELYVRPTYDLCMELLRVGSFVEVIKPQSLRQQMRGWIGDMWEMYEND